MLYSIFSEHFVQYISSNRGYVLIKATSTVNREIFVPLKVGEFALFQLAGDKILHLLQKFNG
jgi:hypothetical protein